MTFLPLHSWGLISVLLRMFCGLTRLYTKYTSYHLEPLVKSHRLASAPYGEGPAARAQPPSESRAPPRIPMSTGPCPVSRAAHSPTEELRLPIADCLEIDIVIASRSTASYCRLLNLEKQLADLQQVDGGVESSSIRTEINTTHTRFSPQQPYL